MQLRLMTYNIHKGIGGIDRRYRLERVAEVIGHYEADVVLLQEVDDGVPRSRGDCQVAELAERLDYRHTLFQPNVRLRRGAYGNAILSRFPIHDPVDVELTVAPKKRRRAQIARLHLESPEHSRTVVVVNLHLGLAGFERRIQLRRLLNEPAFSRTHYDTPLVVAGDFNDLWGTLGRRLLVPQGFASASGRTRTFPAVAPARALDAIYFRGDLSMPHCYRGHIRLAREASDHLPLVAEFEVKMAT